MQRFLSAVDPDASKSSGGRSSRIPHGSTRDIIAWASGFMIGTALVAFAFECLAYNLIYLARILPATGKRAMVLPLFLLFNTLWVLALWSYLQAHSRDPGVVPTVWHEFVGRAGDGLLIVPALAEWQPGKATFCRKCVRPRPERAHHCKICQTCVLRMDHHCPWIGNCVGFHNQKFFLLLGAYAGLACLVIIVSALPELVHSLQVMCGWWPSEADTFAWKHGGLGGSDRLALAMLIVIAVVAFFFVAHTMVIHVSLVCRNLTSIEDFYENMESPYERGSTMANLAEVFGTPGLDWLIPVKPIRPMGDGISFPTLGEASGNEAATAAEVQASGDNATAFVAQQILENLWRRRYGVRKPVQRSGDDGNFSPSTPPWACAPFRSQP